MTPYFLPTNICLSPKAVPSVLAVLCFLWIGHSVYGQQKQIETNQQIWLQYAQHVETGGPWSALGMAALRWKEDPRHPLYLLRAVMCRELVPDLQATLGLTYLGHSSAQGLNRMEIRPHQEFSMRRKIGPAQVRHRYRLEERFFYPVLGGNIQALQAFHLRIRYSLRVVLPLFSLPLQSYSPSLSLRIGDEIMGNLGREVSNNFFDANRLILGPVVTLSPNLKLTLAWINQFSSQSVPGQYLRSDMFLVQLDQKLKMSEG